MTLVFTPDAPLPLAPHPFILNLVNDPDLPLFWTVGALAAGMLIGAGIVAVLVLRRRWLGPVRALATTAGELAGGRWEARAAVDGAEDVAALAGQLNRFAAAAQARVALLKDQRANLKLLVDALPDPVLLSDERDQIVIINAPAERLLQLPPQQAIGRAFVAAVNDPAILDLFEQCAHARDRDAGAPINRELRLTRRGQRLVFQAHAEPTRTNGLLIVLRDVTTLAATIQMKTDFVANASHELRTPISAIKVAFETLRDVQDDADVDGNAGPRDRCMTIIDGHLRRLEEMLRDLLDLSRVENADLKPHLAPVRPFDLIAVLRATWSPVAADKGVALVLPDVRPQDGIFDSDRRLLDLILKNLVENAIKFTPACGRVSVTIERAADAVIACVSDTGCGIPREHAERVFERFYQVDSARSGTAGRGTGLGLAIVKHAVHALGGQVTLESQPGRGTLITCTLPQTTPG